MQHDVTINLGKPKSDGIVACKVVPAKGKILKRVLAENKVTVIIPGDSVRNITIKEIKEGGIPNGKV